MEWKALRHYKGENLREISLPVGGIGTGFFSIGGRGEFADWQVMNRPNRDWKPPFSYLLVRTKQGEAVKLRVMESPLTHGGSSDSGNPEMLAGLPRFQRSEFEATYPFGRVDLFDATLPLDASIEAFNPMIPGDADSSGLPFGLLTITLRNKTEHPVEASLTLLLTNFIGWNSGVKDLKGSFTEKTSVADWHGLSLATDRREQREEFGSICTLWDQPQVRSARSAVFADRAWRHDVLTIIDQLLETGTLEDALNEELPDPGDSGHLGASTASLSIPARGTATARLLISWHFPWRHTKSGGWNLSAEKDPVEKNHYAAIYKNAKDVAEKVIPRITDLRDKTASFVNETIAGPAPDALKEAALFNLASLRTHTCFRLEDGRFYGFEGCNGDSGCCEGSCSHVWNYEQATISLFPDLHRSMLESHLEYNVTPIGADRFRVSIPLMNPVWGAAAADGQMGLVVRAYMQYQKDKDREWLGKHYPAIKRMIQYAWVQGGWDADRDGVMEGAQHNTYDVEFFGANPLCTVWYLAALEAVARLADVSDDKDFAISCRSLREKGAKWVDLHLYNGSYYFQIPKDPNGPLEPMTVAGDGGSSSADRYQVGNGCLVDQLVGQYKANRAGLGDLLDRYHLANASLEIFKNNYNASLQDHYNSMRTFAYADEAGTVICSYPQGGRPKIPFPYWSECMTGFEYQLAVLLLDYGHREEAQRVVQAIRIRHDGKRRNPFNEPECGSFYARAMASWALLEAWGKSPKG
jgi:uncharacterized protein (DUF608 family)